MSQLKEIGNSENVEDVTKIEGITKIETMEAKTIEAKTIEAKTIEAEVIEVETMEANPIEAELIEVKTMEAEVMEAEEGTKIEEDTELYTGYEKLKSNLTVDILIPVYRPDEKFDRLITMLMKQTVQANEIIILHTLEFESQVLELPLVDDRIRVVPIQKADFDHGGTRKYGASLSSADILMFMTQDAVPTNEYLVEELIKPYQEERVAATYGRQLSNENTDLLEAYTRAFNYPATSFMKSKKDLPTLGIKTFFCSNACASYRKSVYDGLGGFVDRTIFNEDMIYASKIINQGYSIAYAAKAQVIHSHNYSYMEQLTRNFDLGVSQKQYERAFTGVSSESEGLKLVKKSIEYLIEQKEYFRIVDLVLNSGFKFLGYQLGIRYQMLPKELVVWLSMNKSYWNK